MKPQELFLDTNRELCGTVFEIPSKPGQHLRFIDVVFESIPVIEFNVTSPRKPHDGFATRYDTKTGFLREYGNDEFSPLRKMSDEEWGAFRRALSLEQIRRGGRSVSGSDSEAARYAT